MDSSIRTQILNTMEEKEAKLKRGRERVKETRVNELEVQKKEAKLEVRIIAKQMLIQS